MDDPPTLTNAPLRPFDDLKDPTIADPRDIEDILPPATGRAGRSDDRRPRRAPVRTTQLILLRVASRRWGVGRQDPAVLAEQIAISQGEVW
jgi:hypothetical protein